MEPFILSDLLKVVGQKCRALDFAPRVRRCVCDCAILSQTLFLRSCKAVGFCEHMIASLRKLVSVKESSMKSELLKMFHLISSLPLVFQYFFETVEFCEVVLLYFNDSSTFSFAEEQIAVALQQFRADDPAFRMILEFFENFEIDERVLTMLLRIFTEACNYNKAEIVFVCENTGFLDFLIAKAQQVNRQAVLPLFVELFSALSIGSDLFIKLGKITDALDSELLAMLWRIVFHDDLGMSTVRPFVQPGPLSFIFRMLPQDTDQVGDFIVFVGNCLLLRTESAWQIALTEFPAQLLAYLSEFRSKSVTDRAFLRVLRLFRILAAHTIRMKDLVSVFGLCTSLEGHIRPVFTRKIVNVLQKMFQRSSDVASFFLMRHDGHIQLPDIPIELLNNGFSLSFDVRLLDNDPSGTFFEFSGPRQVMSVSCSDGAFTFISSIDQQIIPMRMPCTIPTKKWTKLVFVFKSTEFQVLMPGNAGVQCIFEKFVFPSNFTHFQAVRGMNCHIASIMFIKEPIDGPSVDLLAQLPFFPIASFHPSESRNYRSRLLDPLFSDHFRDNLLYLFNASVVSGKFAVNLVGPSTAEVTGIICRGTSGPLSVLDDLRGMEALLPLFGQLDQPVLNANGQPEFIFDEKLLPDLLNLLSVIFTRSISEQIAFHHIHGFAIIAFLLSISGSDYLNDKTVAAICSLFAAIRDVTLARHMIELIMFNLSLWVFTPIPFQLRTYRAFYEAVVAKLETRDRLAYLDSFNISRIIAWMRVYLWDRNTNPSICLGATKASSREALERPDNCQPLRDFFWELAKALSEFAIRGSDVAIILAAACDSSDLQLTSETLSFVIHLVQRRNQCLLLSLKRRACFIDFFDLLTYPDCDVLSKVLQILVFLFKVGPEYVMPYGLREWVSGIMNTLVPGNIDLHFVKSTYNCMVERSGGLGGAPDATRLSIVHPELIPLFLMALPHLEKEAFVEQFMNLIDLLKLQFSTLENLTSFDHPWLFMLMTMWPVPDTILTESANRCLEFLSFIYATPHPSNETHPLIGSVHLFVYLISTRIRHDYSHVLRKIYSDFLSANRSDFKADVLFGIYTVIFRFIVHIPEFDTFFKIDCAPLDATASYNPTFQELFRLQLNSERPQLRTNPGSRTAPDGSWKDAALAALLANVLLEVAITLPHEGRCHDMLSFLIGTGIQHQPSCEIFLKIAAIVLSRIDQKRTVAVLFGNMIRTRLQLNSREYLSQAITHSNSKLAEFLHQKFKLKLPHIEDSRILDTKLEALSPVVELAVSYEDQFLRDEGDEISEFYDGGIAALVERTSRFANQISSLNSVDARKAREMSDQDLVRTSLEAFATRARHASTSAAKEYKRIFENLSTYNGPWQSLEDNSVQHRKLSQSIVGHFCRFQMKRNARYSDHKDASAARDTGKFQTTAEDDQKELIKLRMTQFRGDFALVAARNAKREKSFISDFVVLKCDARWVTVEAVYSGTLSLTAKSIYYESPEKFLSLSLACVRSIFLRRYLLIDSALEIFTTRKKSFFFDFSEDQRKLFLSELSPLELPARKFIQMSWNDISPLLQNTVTRWTSGHLSNFELLMKINKYAGRSYNDLSQYPVFPWVIADYESPKLNLSDRTVFRDLTKPLGALCESRLEGLRERMRVSATMGEECQFLYGSFYSSAAVVIGYLIRVEPFTTLHIQLQSGKFDHADRLFSSIPRAWQSASGGQSDFRELIPEFFYFPDFLVNENRFDLGLTARKEPVDDVELPAWAETPWDFVATNRLALESPYVTFQLPAWINLIFGPQSRTPLAAQADNLFHPYFFETALVGAEPQAIALIKEYAACFGAAPVQIFASELPARTIAPHPLQHCLLGMTAGIPRLSGVIAAAYDKSENLVTAVGLKGTFVRLPIEMGEKFQGHLVLPLPSELEDRAYGHLKIALAGTAVILSLPWDSAFYLFKVSSGVTQPTTINRIHRERITVIAAAGRLLATAAKDCSLRIWHMTETPLRLVAFTMKHRTPVKLIRINEKLQICISVSSDGFVLAISTANGRFLHAFELGESDPALLEVSEFGCVVIGFNQGGVCLVKVLDQNLRPIADRKVNTQICCWKYVRWGDGVEYLIASLAGGRLVLFKLPFMEELDLDFKTDFTVAGIDFVPEPIGVLLTDANGRLFFVRPYAQR
jgi:hypothetical protein